MDKLFTKLSVIGLDDPGAAVRSIGVTRTSVYHGHFTTPAHPGVPETDAEHLYGDLFRANDTNCGERYMGARCEQGGYIPSTRETGDKGDCAFPGDGGVMICGSQPADGRTAYNGPVIKGRGDMLASIKSPGTDSGSGGVWTGVRQGSPALGSCRPSFQPVPDVLLFHQSDLELGSEELNVLLNLKSRGSKPSPKGEAESTQPLVKGELHD